MFSCFRYSLFYMSILYFTPRYLIHSALSNSLRIISFTPHYLIHSALSHSLRIISFTYDLNINIPSIYSIINFNHI